MQEVPGTRATSPTTGIASIAASCFPIAGNGGLINMDSKGYTHVMIDNLLDTDISLAKHAYVGSVEKIAIV